MKTQVDDPLYTIAFFKHKAGPDEEPAMIEVYEDEASEVMDAIWRVLWQDDAENVDSQRNGESEDVL